LFPTPEDVSLDLIVAEETLDSAARMSPKMLRMGSGLALLVATLFLPLEYLYRTGDSSFSPRIATHLTHAFLAIAGIVASYFPQNARRTDTLAVLIVIGMGGNALAYFALTPGYPSLLSNALALLLFGATVICGWSPRRTALVGTLFAQGFVLVGLLAHRSDVPHDRFVFSIGALLFASVIAAFCASIMEAARTGIARREEELEELSNRLMSVQEEERRRLSRELHDGVGQGLTAVVSHLWLLERRLPGGGDELRTQVSEARGIAAKTLAEIRELSQLLRPSLLDDWGLVPSLEAQVKTFKTHQEIDIELETAELPDRLSPELETAVYRIVQEALTNVAKHARATSVRVALRHAHDGLHLDVVDNGVGYRANGDGRGKPGLGLLSIRERVRALGGRITMTSERGAHISIVLPLTA
jgi:signal transduction histidine kinase